MVAMAIYYRLLFFRSLFVGLSNKSLGREEIVQHINFFGITIGMFTVKYESWYTGFVFAQI